MNVGSGGESRWNSSRGTNSGEYVESLCRSDVRAPVTDSKKRKWPEERVPIDLEPIPGFNLRASVVGHQGMFVKHIQQETRCRVQIKGRGSGFMENGIG